MIDEIKQKQIINLSKKLIKIESVEQNIKAQEECIDILEKTFNKSFYIKRYNLGGHPALVMSTTKKKVVDVIFSGHIDVVPGEKALFRPVIKGKKLFGRGSYDMKAGVVASIYAVADYKKAGGDKEIAIMVTSDEETSGYGTKTLLEKHGYSAKFAFIPDGGFESGIVLKQKGFMQLKVEVVGKSAHAAYAWEGDNALILALRLQEIIEKEFPVPTKHKPWQTGVVLTKIETKNSINQVPDSAHAYFDVRFVDNKDPKRIISLINKIIGRKGKVNIIEENDMFFTSEKDYYVQKLAQILSRHTKKKVLFTNECGTSDAVFFSSRGIPTALFRPRGGGQHQNEEWIDIDSLYRMYEVLGFFLDDYRKT